MPGPRRGLCRSRRTARIGTAVTLVIVRMCSPRRRRTVTRLLRWNGRRRRSWMRKIRPGFRCITPNMHSDHHGAMLVCVRRLQKEGWYCGAQMALFEARRFSRSAATRLLIGKWLVMGTCCGENYDPERGYAVCLFYFGLTRQQSSICCNLWIYTELRGDKKQTLEFEEPMCSVECRKADMSAL